MTPDKCPGCGAKLRPDMLACPNCPMSFPEDDGPSVGAVNPLKQSRYYKFVFPTVLLGVIGFGVWYMGMGLLHLGQENAKPDGVNVLDQITKGAAPKKSGAAVSSEAAASTGADASSEPKPEDGDGTVFITHVDGDGVPFARDERQDQTKIVRPAAPPPKAPTEWKLRGTVYDLTTLKPLAGCMMVFSDDATDRAIKTRTDSAGRYRTILPPLPEGTGYSVAIEKNGYAPNYLDPGTEGVREMDSGRRWGMARDLSSMLSPVPATVASASAKPVITDFYLAPRP